MVALQKSVCSFQHTVPDWRHGIVAESLAMQRLLDQVERIAPSSLPILLLGETGTGKDVLARALHEASDRLGPFIPFNCAAVPSTLAESEFFGHCKGSFSGACADKPGLIEEAHEGTLFLDEIADLDPLIQAKLLRVLEDGQVRRIGGSRPVSVDVRLICATHKNLFAEMQAGRFRDDLFHRLAGITLIVPPLRERPEDILPLVELFLKQETKGNQLPKLSEQAVNFLLSHPWPGNVRELRQAVRRAVILGGETLDPQDFQENLPASFSALPSLDWMKGKTWREIEIAVLTEVVWLHGNPCAAARALGLAKSTVYERVRRWGIEPSCSLK